MILYWHCAACGVTDFTDPEARGEQVGYEEPCVDCAAGIARVRRAPEVGDEVKVTERWLAKLEAAGVSPDWQRLPGTVVDVERSSEGWWMSVLVQHDDPRQTTRTYSPEDLEVAS